MCTLALRAFYPYCLWLSCMCELSVCVYQIYINESVCVCLISIIIKLLRHHNHLQREWVERERGREWKRKKMSYDISRVANFIIYFSKSRGIFGLFKSYIYIIFFWFYYVVCLAIRLILTFVIFHFVAETKINKLHNGQWLICTHSQSQSWINVDSKKRRMYSIESYHSFTATSFIFHSWKINSCLYFIGNNKLWLKFRTKSVFNTFVSYEGKTECA